jgi:hypothetical protein
MRRLQGSDGRRSPFPSIRWLGSAALENPLIGMLHAYRAAMTKRDKALPAEERLAYQFRRARVFAKGRDLGPAQAPPVAAAAALEPSAFAADGPERPGDVGTPAGEASVPTGEASAAAGDP